MNALEVILLGVLCTGVVVLLRLAPAIKGTLGWSLSGETGSLVAGGFLSRGVRERRTVELRAVLSRLSLITRLNMPLCAALDVAARGESPRMEQILQKLSRSIAVGMPVSAALEAAIDGCPVQLVAILQRAEACGQLPQAIAEEERMVAGSIDAGLNSTAHTRDAVAYTSLMMLLCAAFVSWVMIMIMPMFQDIFLDYDTPLPPVTRALIGMAQASAMYGGWVLAVGLLVTLCALFVCVRARTGENPGGIARIVAALRWTLPITRTLDYGLGMAKAIRSMALEIRAGTPTAFTATLPSVVSTTNHLRQRLTRFSQAVSDGIAPHKAAANAELGDVFVCALKMVEHGEDPERVLGHAADYYEAIAYRWWHALTALSGPLTTLAIAAMVGFIALALFLPLVALIDATAESI